jgi:hypothetical protein
VPFNRKHGTRLFDLLWTQRIPADVSPPEGFQLNSNLALR